MAWMVVAGSLLHGPLCLPQGNEWLMLRQCSLLSVAFCAQFAQIPRWLLCHNRKGREKWQENSKACATLSIPEGQEEGIHRAAHQSSELLLHLKETGQRGAYLMHLPNWGEPRYGTAVVSVVMVNWSYHL